MIYAKDLADIAKLNPSVENQLRYDTSAKLVMMIDKSSKSGADSVFISSLINAINGSDSLSTNLRLIIDDADLNNGKKNEIIDNVLNQFNEKRLTLKNFEIDVKDAIDAAKAFVDASWNPPILNVDSEPAKTKITGLSEGLKEFEGTAYNVVRNVTGKIVDFGKLDERAKLGISGVEDIVAGFAQITQSALAAKAAMDSVGVAQQAANQPVMDVYAGTNADITNINPSLGAGDWSGLSTAFMPLWMKDPTEKFYDAYVTKKDEYDYRLKQGWEFAHYAKGGIATQPSIFGEAGAEAAVPLPDGRSIPVTLTNTSNDDGATVAELKAQNQKLEMLVNTLMATSKAEREKTQELIDAMNGLRTDTRLKRAA